MGLSIEEQRNNIRLENSKETNQNKNMIRYNNKKLLTSQFMFKGLYFLYNDEKIVYVGQSKTNVMQRLCDHFKDNSKIFDSFKIFDNSNLSDMQLDKKEKYYINKLNPMYNIIHVHEPIKIKLANAKLKHNSIKK